MPLFNQKTTRGEFNRLRDGTSPQVTGTATPAAIRSNIMGRIAEFQTERNPAMTSPQPVSALMTPPSPGSTPSISPGGGPPPPAPGDGGGLRPALVDMSSKKGGPLAPSDLPAQAFESIGQDPSIDEYLSSKLIDEMTYHASIKAGSGAPGQKMPTAPVGAPPAMAFS
jgi:hypothetical protein|tara:strand:+ start:266 stop:769 length:504 start_codon:yes stop_codon:yes gene_type:complete